MDINKQKARLIKRFNTITINLNKDLIKSSAKESTFNKDQIKANANIESLEKFIKNNNLSKYIYPIRLRNVRFKGAKLSDKTIALNKKLTKINDIVTHINNTTDQNDLIILNNLIDDNYIFKPAYRNKPFSESKVFNEKINVDYIFDDTYYTFVIKVGDINFQLDNMLYMPLKYSYNFSQLYDLLIDDKIKGTNNYYSSETRGVFYKMPEETQVNLVLSILERVESKYMKLDVLLSKLTPNTKIHNAIAKYQVFK